MPTLKKERAIDELRKRLADAKYLFFTNYSGLTVGEIGELRARLRKGGSSYTVVKNTLFSIAAGEALSKELEEFLAGPTGVVFAPDDPIGPAKALRRFADDVKPIEVKAAYGDGKLIDRKQIDALAAMPPKAELQAMLLGMFAGPMRGFARVLAANSGGFVRLLNARAQQLGEPAS